VRITLDLDGSSDPKRLDDQNACRIPAPTPVCDPPAPGVLPAAAAALLTPSANVPLLSFSLPLPLAGEGGGEGCGRRSTALAPCWN